ncbi:MAG: aminotransferase class III-fold pyridoxal phosphate-dependent enzyme [Lachnospiraceae bacterium]|nr:aminotransferase class III-fold pyridoxal phosphate-dependent enzyme [Lachnospiraceae bacterium]
MGKSQELYVKAKKLIPTGTELLSKRPEMFLPDLWPSYYKKAEGCKVWDLDGKEYYDFAQMGVGSCTLGYADVDVNNAVLEAVRNGSMCTLNSYEEVELAEQLIALHKPWAERARFARSGGEACAIAIRIARAKTRKNKVAFCGYHGWSDWYISANIGDETQLDEQLLPGLKPTGVPRMLQGTALPFLYNDLESLEELVNKYPDDIAAIIMEPRRGEELKEGFLEGVRRIADRIDAVLIFDEITAGFRLCIGGIHKLYGVNPDMAVFGKALGNGFPITAIIGTKDVMVAAESSFISSTFWTERIGFTAGVATLKKMEKINSPKILIEYGDKIVHALTSAAEKAGLKLCVSHIAPLAHIDWDYENGLAVQTLYAQIMLDRGYLVSSAIYSTVAYNDEIIDRFAKDTGEAFEIIAEAIKEGTVEKHLRGPVKQSGFARLVK